MVHGDDFLAVGTKSNLQALISEFEGQFQCKHELIGPQPELGKELKVIGRWIRCTTNGWEVEVDTRYIEEAIDEYGMGNDGKPASTPSTKEKEETHEDR